MTFNHLQLDDDDAYLEFFQLPGAEEARRRAKAGRRSKKSRAEIMAQIVEPAGLEAGFSTTYVPARYEKEWLAASLQSFYDEALIVDVLAKLKGGKEANVYRCAAHPGTGLGLVAAKVYRPRMFRNLRNDKVYRDGRPILTARGSSVKEKEQRVMRALGKKTGYGAQVEHTSWLMYEYTTLQVLHADGAAVPRPLSVNDNAIVMGYHGDAQRAAATLNEVVLDKQEAQDLFHELLRNMRIMLHRDLIHGDLSAYNILYWQGQITLIDFPQVVNSQTNRRARSILARDVERVCQYFSQQGVSTDPAGITADLWEEYARIHPLDEAADASAALAEEFEDESG